MNVMQLFAIGSVVAIYIARLMELATDRGIIAGKIRENVTLRLFMMVGTLMLLGSVAEMLLREITPGWGTIAAGWLVAICSFALRRRAIAALGKFWSLHVEIRENHEFVRSGPFRWVRHPAYLSMILEIISVGVLTNAFTALAVCLALFFPVLIARVNIEERELIGKFGSAYEEYRQTTPALLPCPWKSRNL
jgi:protein-S-isoprenylcysteine O-methyltransferase Ste14